MSLKASFQEIWQADIDSQQDGVEPFDIGIVDLELRERSNDKESMAIDKEEIE